MTACENDKTNERTSKMKLCEICLNTTFTDKEIYSSYKCSLNNCVEQKRDVSPDAPYYFKSTDNVVDTKTKNSSGGFGGFGSDYVCTYAIPYEFYPEYAGRFSESKGNEVFDFFDSCEKREYSLTQITEEGLSITIDPKPYSVVAIYCSENHDDSVVYYELSASDYDKLYLMFTEMTETIKRNTKK